MGNLRPILGGNALLDPLKILNKAGIAEGQKVADLGCGTAGHFVIPAARMVGDKGHVYAVDILKSALEGVKSRAKLEGITNLDTIWSDLEVYNATKIDTNSLDVALLINVLFQTKKHDEILKETARMLKSGGTLLVVDWKMTDIPAFGPDSEMRIDPEKIKQTAQDLNLELTKEFEAGKFHFALTFKKK